MSRDVEAFGAQVVNIELLQRVRDVTEEFDGDQNSLYQLLAEPVARSAADEETARALSLLAQRLNSK